VCIGYREFGAILTAELFVVAVFAVLGAVAEHGQMNALYGIPAVDGIPWAHFPRMTLNKYDEHVNI
jgi:hypothetical protein